MTAFDVAKQEGREELRRLLAKADPDGPHSHDLFLAYVQSFKSMPKALDEIDRLTTELANAREINAVLQLGIDMRQEKLEQLQKEPAN